MLLASRGRARAVIVVPENRQAVLPVARELRRILKAMTAASFPIEREAGKQPVIVLRLQPTLLDTYKRRVPRPQEAVAWRCDGKRVLEIAGSDAEALWHALYAFLEEKLDCRWFFPGRAGEDIPKTREPAIGRHKVKKTPSYITRDMYLWPDAFRRCKLGGGPRMTGIHSYARIVPERIVKKHREYGVMINGERQTHGGYQLCVSQKGVEDLAVQYCLDYFKQNPDELIVGVSPNDGENFCDCPKCVRTNLGRRRHAGEESPWWVTRSIFEFTNRVAKRVAEVHPDKLVLTISYSRTKEPMRGLKIRDNVLVDYCSQPHFNWQGKGARERLEREITAWCEAAKHVGIFDYIINQSWPGLVRPLTDILGHELKYFHKRGVRYYYSQHSDDFGVNLPNYYLMAALLWDVKRDSKKLLDDMYKRCFRTGAAAVKRYFTILEDAIMEQAKTGPGPGTVDITGHRNAHEDVCTIYTPEIMAEAGDALKEAARLTKGDRVATKRLSLIRKAFQYLKVARHAAQITFDFESRYRVKSFTPWAWNVGNYDYHNTLEKMEMFGKPCVKHFCQVRAAWKEYRRLRYKLEKELVLTPRYSRGGRSFDPKETLDNIWGLYTGRLKKVPRLVTAKSALRAM